MEATAAEVAADVLEPLELSFADILLLSSLASSHPPHVSPSELLRLESLTDAIMQALGPSGPGLLAIVGVPRGPRFRRTLLPLARKLSLLSRKDCGRVLKEHGIGTDVPLKNLDRNVSSFALNLKYEQDLSSESLSTILTSTKENNDHGDKHDDKEFKSLGSTFKELALCMMELGLRIAQICDKAIDCGVLKQCILDGSAKGRLIHYHSMIDNVIVRETNTSTRSKKKVEPSTGAAARSNECSTSGDFPIKSGKRTLHEQTFTHWYPGSSYLKERMGRTSVSSLWQQWHYDYGIFTVLTSPSFMFSCQAEDCTHISCCKECSSPDEHTYLQLFDVERTKIYAVKSSPESFIVQVGEAASILTRGKIRSTLHSVGRPFLENLSRETFVVFLQPSWSKVLSHSGYTFYDETRDLDNSAVNIVPRDDEEDDSLRYNSAVNIVPRDDEEDDSLRSTVSSQSLLQEILGKIPPLSMRYRDGMTFAEFSRETTKQYYGTGGTQSTR